MHPQLHSLFRMLAILALGITEAAAVGPVHVPQSQSKQGAFVLDGSFVHNVGELQLNVTNWGLLGSMPSTSTTFSTAPSAMWPASSGIDHLFAAGLWIGGIKNGIPLVSTGQYETELMASGDPRDTIFEMKEGDPGSARYPFPGEDDDNDGQIDEDPKDGRDNDGDGRIDEDFGAIGNQHFRLTMRDDTRLSRVLFPDHEPLGIEVVQESYQWAHPRLDDFVAFDVTIRNIGPGDIESMAVGMFADADIGPRDRTDSGRDDMVGFFDGFVRDSDNLRVPISMAYAYDCDGDGGLSPGYIGFLFLNQGSSLAPAPITSFHHFSVNRSFDRGGAPKSDQQRYELMTDRRTDPSPESCELANDYRLLASFEPFAGGRVPPGGEVRFQMAIVMGAGLRELKENAANAVQTYWGEWFNRDGDRDTGVEGRETLACLADYGPSLFRQFVDCNRAGNEAPIRVVDLDSNQCIWINGDCFFEALRGVTGTCPDNPSTGCTGVLGREFNVPWFGATLPRPPQVRIWESNRKVHVFWENEAEGRRDPDTGDPNFESYQIWRVSNWTRPAGSSIATGPGSAGWELIGAFDLPDSFQHRRRLRGGGVQVQWLPLGANTGMAEIAYEPAVLRSGSAEEQRFRPLAQLLEELLTSHPELTPGDRIRYRDPRGQVTALGREYPDLRQWECCYDQVDTLAWSHQGRRFYEFIDPDVHNGHYYFYAVTVGTRRWQWISGQTVPVGYGPAGRPRGNAVFAVPQSNAQPAHSPDPIYVVPNPATRGALSEFSQLQPNSDDPTGVRLEFRNLPRGHNVVRIFTLSGDLVETLRHDGTTGRGSTAWNLVARNGIEVVSGVYLFSVESDLPGFSRFVGRFVVIR